MNNLTTKNQQNPKNPRISFILSSHFPKGFALIALLLSAQPSLAQSDINVRIGIVQQTGQELIGVSRRSTVKGLYRGKWKTIGDIEPEEGWQVQAVGRQLKLQNSDANCLCNQETYQRVQLEPENGLVFADNHWYRGQLDLYPVSSSQFAVVNELPLEQYLLGVVPSEMPTSWPLEALKAQAVAARTYTVSGLGSFSSRGYDLVDTVQSQVYLGVDVEKPSSNEAVAQTRGQIMTYQGKPINAYFHSTSGGMTENGHELWGPFPYLKPVVDFDNESPRFTWYKEITQASLRQSLAKMKIYVGNVLDLEPVQRTETGRVKTLRIIGDSGQKNIDAMKFRLSLGLNSTFFNVGRMNGSGEIMDENDRNRPAQFQFAGRGWGHGLGMSQWGARQLAINGSGYRDILTHYYSGVKIENFRNIGLKVAKGK